MDNSIGPSSISDDTPQNLREGLESLRYRLQLVVSAIRPTSSNNLADQVKVQRTGSLDESIQTNLIESNLEIMTGRTVHKGWVGCHARCGWTLHQEPFWNER
mmetsp:Transcript_23129/g.57133  ORF Transcript_23129/g.57133 Transcript_23129/m.57133 type:complete len:102 (+) Transcript_23129:1451-1756(+)